MFESIKLEDIPKIKERLNRIQWYLETAHTRPVTLKVFVNNEWIQVVSVEDIKLIFTILDDIETFKKIV